MRLPMRPRSGGGAIGSSSWCDRSAVQGAAPMSADRQGQRFLQYSSASHTVRLEYLDSFSIISTIDHKSYEEHGIWYELISRLIIK